MRKWHRLGLYIALFCLLGGIAEAGIKNPGAPWSAIQASISAISSAAKGSLITFSASNTAGALAVGADGTIPIANSNSTNGIDWFGQYTGRPKVKTGRIIVPFYSSSLSSTSYSTSNIYTVPVYVGVRQTFTGEAFGVVTAATALNVKVGIYADSSGLPGALIAGSTATGGPYTDITDTSHTVTYSVALTLDPGWYWLAIQTDQTQTLKAVSSTGAVASLGGAADMITTGTKMTVANTYSNGMPSTFGTVVFTESAASAYLGLVAQ